MKVLVNNAELDVLNCYPYRFNNGKLVLRMEILQANIEHDALKALLKANTGDVVQINDDGTQTSYSGFQHAVSITDKEEVIDNVAQEIYFIEIECKSESDYLIGVLWSEIEKQKNEIETQKNEILAQSNLIVQQINTINAQADEILLLNDTLLEILMADETSEYANVVEESEVVA